MQAALSVRASYAGPVFEATAVAGSTMAGSTMTALLLTAMGAAGTALGGLMVVAQPKMDFKRLGVLQVGR